MLKKIFCLLLLLLFAKGTVFAQSSPSIQIKEKTSAGLEDFFQKIQSRNYESAYQMMDDDFIESTPFEDFKLILSETGLTTFHAKMWISYEEKMLGLLAIIKGNFSTPDGQVHHLEFDVFNDAHTIKIRNILESISSNSLKKRFPPKEKLEEMVRENLGYVTEFIFKNKAKNLYAYLSPSAKGRIKMTSILLSLRNFRQQKLDLTLSEEAPIKILRFYPRLNPQGLMTVRGTYENEKNKVNFVLLYSYQWEWKLAEFSFRVKTSTGAMTE